MRPFRTAAVIGAGTMGTGIATHLAGAGVRCHLLDIVPPDLPAAARATPEGRSKLANDALKRALEQGAFLDPADRPLVVPGNLEDHLERLRECDWIVEAVVEKLEVKRDLFKKIAPLCHPEAIVSSNTSGLALHLLMEGLPLEFRQRFLITHFFNPPRHMYLLETVAGADTRPDVLAAIEGFAERGLGKGVVRCKDTPNFIANRIGVYAMALNARLMEEEKLSIEEVDAITGRPMARPKIGSFSLLDLVGIDVAVLVQENSQRLLLNDESRADFTPTALLKKLIAAGRLGRKTQAGFYKKVGKDLLVLDPVSFEYRPQKPVKFASIDSANKERTPGARLKAMVNGNDAAARYAWKLLSGILVYTARRIPEIADDVVSVDRALRWGFSWDLGPFECWDAIGVRESTARMEKEGVPLPSLVKELLASGRERFYESETRGGSSVSCQFVPKTRAMEPVPSRAGIVDFAAVRTAKKPLLSKPAASLWELDGGVLCVELHSKMNTINGETLDVILESVDAAERGPYAGLVIGTAADYFSAGANLADMLKSAEEKRFAEIESMIRKFHGCAMRLRYARKPIVSAVRGLALGGGCEIPLASHRVQAAAETYTGLVELGVGLIPAGGGTRELACRAAESLPPGVEVDLFPFVRKAFETIALGKTSSSAMDARSMGILRAVDGISMDRERILADACAVVSQLAATGFRPPRPRTEVRVVGASGLAELQVIIHLLRSSGNASEYDAHLATKLAGVLCGGEIDEEFPVSEEYLLDLEREAFLSLLGEKKTHERIAHMLKVGKPLRN